ncbi:hypothetical protein Cantr_03647 [Candida viswanathii]|uniref:Endonuclease/exonuclease/phosphatase domain-containing protein n=1 Tax=Candida viswanathii TaxID=5486 RepID=A0A367XLA0_9ASCO|nr:hypothetical protein Cantr_03647 [Candida viswanathii]
MLPLAISETQGSTEIMIYDHNVRYAAPLFKRASKELPWSDRRKGVVNAIKLETTGYSALVGLQETDLAQLQDILQRLNQDEPDDQKWTYFGRGRGDGKEKGEYSPVLYKKSDWKLITATTKWLSLTPDKPSKYSGADKNRIVTIATFMHNKSGKVVNFLNTHLDHKSKAAREHSANLILRYVKSLPSKYPTFLIGDFNSKESDEVYRIVSREMADSSKIAENLAGAELNTFSGFGDKKMYSIDFIWFFNSTKCYSTIVPIYHAVVDNYMDNGFRFSDHRPIVARFLI